MFAFRSALCGGRYLLGVLAAALLVLSSTVRAEFMVSPDWFSWVWTPDVGCAEDPGLKYLVVWRRFRITQPAHISAMQVLSETELPFYIPEVEDADAEDKGEPAVAGGTSNWLVAWNSYSDEDGQYRIRARVVSPFSMSEMICIAQSPDPKYPPDVAFNGEEYLVVWSGSIIGRDDIFGQRVSAAGSLLGPSFCISDAEGNKSLPAVTSDGNGYLVCWERAKEGGPCVEACSVAADGTVGPSFSISSLASNPDVTFNGERYIVVWRQDAPTPGIHGVRCTNQETEGDHFVMCNGSELSDPKVHAERLYGNCLVVWGDSSAGHDIRGQRVNRLGVPVGPQLDICSDTARQMSLGLASDGERLLAVWADWRHAPSNPHASAVYGQFTPAWEEDFYSQTELATAFNQGRNLALDPSTGTLHAVYWSGVDGIDTVYYTYSNDNGTHWAPYEVVDTDAAFPCVVCEDDQLWISYQKPVAGRLVCKYRSGVAPWEEYDLYADVGTPGPPSISRVYFYGPGAFCGVYVVFTATQGNVTTIQFRVVQAPGGVVYSRQLDQQSSPDVCLTPSVATTPGDIVHVAWKRLGDYQGLRRELAMYCQWPYRGDWSEPTEMSDWVLEPNCEPAFNPCIDAYGDALVGVWDAPWGQRPHEVWRRDKEAWQHEFPLANVPGRRSHSENAPSLYPQNSTSGVVAWQEKPAPEGIYAFIEGVAEPFAIYEDNGRSLFPDIFAELPEGPYDPTFLNTLWTHEEVTGPGGIRTVRFLRYEHALCGGRQPAYYDCGIGDSVLSYYCQSRDGWARWREYKVDFGRERLRYRLPFLNPNCIYVMRAVLYHAARDTWVQTFSLDGRAVGRFAYRGLAPETVWVTVPRELYREDCEVMLDVTRTTGEYASLASLVLFQRYPFRQGGQGKDYAGAEFVVADGPVRFTAVHPSPFRVQTRVSYSVMSEQCISVRVYDVQGRLVRQLASGLHQPGTYTVLWNGTDDRGRRLAAGTYLCRLEPTAGAKSLAVVLAR